MIRDARQLEDGSVLSCDLCVAGAGAAGITLARALAGSRTKVCLLEGGGEAFEDDVQSLYAGSNVGLPYFDLDVCRLRYFGGTTNHWHGRCRPLDPIDFEAREWVPLSGWPFGRAELEPYYRRAHEICELGRYGYRPDALDVSPDRLLPLDPAKFEHVLWQYSPPTRFAEAYRSDLESADNLDVVLHANVMSIDTDEEGRTVQGLEVGTLDGRRFAVRARLYVLACGGLETPRLLLASNHKVSPGVGNHNDMVGRCFMDHPHLSAARLLLADPGAIDWYNYSLLDLSGTKTPVLGALHASPKLQRREGLLNYDAHVLTDNIGYGGYAALRRIWNAIEQGEVPDDLGGDLWRALADIDDTFAGLLGRFEIREYQPEEASFRLWSVGEQAPNPDSRVMLGEEKDALGLPRIRLDWRMSALDKRSIRGAHQTLAAELGRTGLGRMRIDEWLTADDHTWPAEVTGGFHHMGTTRMAADPREGVVDADCRVHGVDNLYVAGSSVFATGGSANPTLTIVALALRLAETLQERLAA